jgi:hypothetical protein
MPYAVIEDFRGGLDRRRKRTVGQPGTLWECTNALITRGGEVEKRKKLVEKFVLPVGTFGMESGSGILYVFGSGADPGVPAGVTYQRLQHPDGVAIASILDTEVFDGKVFAIAKFTDDSVHKFYDGEIIPDWDTGIVRAAMTNNDGIAAHLTALIDADPAYDASRSGSVITIAAAVAGTPFEITSEVENVEDGTDDQTITLTDTVPNIPGVTEVLATATFSVTGGTNNAGTNKISSIKVNGVEILSTAVDWVTSNSGTATNVAAQINSFASTPEYSASASGEVVTISAAAGSGAGPNGFTVAVTVAGDVTVSTATAMAGGVTAVTGQVQEATATIGGTFEVGDKFTITIDEKVFGHAGNPSRKGNFAFTHKKKVHVLAGSIDQYSGLNDPTAWNLDDTGAGFQNLASNDSGSEELIGVGRFQGNLAFFSRRSAQTRYVDVDDSKDIDLQVLENTGTLAGRSIQAFGDTDLFFLSDAGVRSLRQVNGTNNVYPNDVGTAIDDLILEHLATLTDAQVSAALAIIEPRNNRYWLSMDETTYVFSYFAGAKISAWSTMEFGFVVSEYAVIENRIYVRSGDTIYLYGGDTGLSYDEDEDDAYTVTVSTPFISRGRIASDQYITGFDLSVDGTWEVWLLHDSNNFARKTRLGEVTDDTYQLQDLAAAGCGPLFAIELICTTPGAAKVANFALHYKDKK